MAEPHLSVLQLDEVSAGLPLSAEAETHLAGCGSCQEKRVGLDAERAALRQNLGYVRTRKALLGKQKPAGVRPAQVLVPLLALAAAAMLIVVVPARLKPGSVRYKGQAALMLLDESFREVAVPQVGQKVRVGVGSGPFKYVHVFTVTEEGPLKLFPVRGAEDARLDGTAKQALGRTFEVTAGETLVFAVFSAEKPDEAALGAQLEDQWRSAGGAFDPRQTRGLDPESVRVLQFTPTR